ncbi:MAG: NHL repeat-containing protein [Planctomycetota bacterium]|jgi:hypothetical protein
MKLKNILVSSIVLLVIVLCVQSFGEEAWNKKVVLKSVDFAGNHKEDGFWAAIHAGADGKVYIGLNTEGGGHAHFYIYDPVQDKMIHRADMGKFLGGSGKGIKTHAKIHSKICEDKEGNIYFATGNMGAGPGEVDPMSWEGGHWVKYEPKTDKLEDLGLVAPYRGIYGLAIDKERGLLLGVCRNGHFMVYDIASGQTVDKGRVNLYATTCARVVVSDDEGNAYGTFCPDRMFKYDARSGRVLDLSVRLPSDATIYPRAGSIAKRYMRAGVWDDVNRKMYGVEGGTSILFEYDPKAGEEGQIKALSRLLPYQGSEELRKGHYATLNFALGKDRKIYYLPIGSMSPKDHAKANKRSGFFGWVGQGYLISYNLKIGEKENHGRVYTQDGAKVIGFLNSAPSGGGTTGPDGTIYFCSFVEQKNPELVARYTGSIPGSLKLLIYEP